VPVLGSTPSIPYMSVEVPEGSFLVAERGFSSGISTLSRQRSVERSEFGLGVLWLHICVASEIYKLTAEKLRQLCSEEGLDSEGAVRSLRQRLVRHLTTSMMASKQDVELEQASVQTNLSSDATHGGPQNPSNSSHVGGCDNAVPVVVELLRHVPFLSSEKPEAILRMVSKLDEIQTIKCLLFVSCLWSPMQC